METKAKIISDVMPTPDAKQQGSGYNARPNADAEFDAMWDSQKEGRKFQPEDVILVFVAVLVFLLICGTLAAVFE